MNSGAASAAIPPACADVPTAHPSAADARVASLNDRVPAQAVIAKLQSVRENEGRRSLLGRIFGSDPLSIASRSWYQGALGEIRVGRILRRLGEEWTVLHSVPVGSGASDIDHVLIGPAGVFTVNTKNHSNQSIWVAGRTVMVGSKKQRYIPTSEYEAVRAGKLLSAAAGESVKVTPVVVFVEPKSLKIKEQPENVVLPSDRQLLRWLGLQKPSLGVEKIAHLSATAALPTAWHRGTSTVDDTAALQQEFGALRRLVGRARRRRAGWAIGATAGLSVAAFHGVPLILATLMRILQP